jgi:hypothetical protein
VGSRVTESCVTKSLNVSDAVLKRCSSWPSFWQGIVILIIKATIRAEAKGSAGCRGAVKISKPPNPANADRLSVQMAQYDASILQKFADRLYEKAGFITFQCVIVGFLIGAALAGIPAAIISNQQDEARTKLIEERYRGAKNSFCVPPLPPPQSRLDPFVLCVIGGVFGGVVGGFIGQRKGFQYRLQAQLTLCQMQIEHNTHRD